MPFMRFPEYLETKFLEWQTKQGKRKTLEEFAAFLGVSRPLLNMWMNGSRKPGKENVRLLSAVFGLGIYEILDLPKPDPLYAYTERNWNNLPEKEQKRIAEIVAKYTIEPIPDETRAAHSE